jgi:23S rRNA (guanosine2251-2'-O)-methyltransferase
MELLAGVHSVREALRARRRVCRRLLLAARGDLADELATLAAEAGVRVETTSPGELERRVGGAVRSQGIVLEAEALPTESFEALLNRIRAPHACLVATDGVEDPQNLGAIARVADAAGAHGLVLTDRRSPPLSPAVSRASAGAIEHLPVARVPNLARALEEAQGAGYWTIGADAERGASIFDPGGRHWEGSVVLVLGSEGRGIRPGLAKHLDHWVRIPMSGHVTSLNVAAAAAVLLFDRRRHLAERTLSAGRQEGAQTRPPT